MGDLRTDRCTFAMHGVGQRAQMRHAFAIQRHLVDECAPVRTDRAIRDRGHADRSEEHTSELQSLMRISYAVFCLKKKKTHRYKTMIAASTHERRSQCQTRHYKVTMQDT